MEERVNEVKCLAKGVRIDQNFLKQLNGALNQQWPSANMKITAVCNNAKFTYTGLEDFLSKIDSIQYIIDRLDIDVYESHDASAFFDEDILLSFSCKPDEPPITEKIFLNRVSEYQAIHESLKSIFKNNHLWYGSLASTPLLVLIAGTIGIAFTIWLLDTTIRIRKSIIFCIYICIFYIGAMSATPRAARVKSYLFPKNEIYFGCNKRRIDTAAKVRNFIFIVVIMGLVIGVIFSIISNWIFH